MSKSQGMRERYLQGLREIWLWVMPGLGVKRWFLFLLAGITLLGVGVAMLLLELYRTDSTNPDTLRGVIRGELLPALRKLHPAAEENIRRLVGERPRLPRADANAIIRLRSCP